MKPRLITLGDLDHLDGLRVVPFASSPEIVGEPEKGPCEGIVRGSSSPFRSGEEYQEEST